jgi:rSAM/selenodomain-associated transferase 1
MARKVVILFAKAPCLGTVKKRLACGIGDVAALRFYKTTLAGTLRKLNQLRGCELVLAVTPRGAFLRHPPGWRVMGQSQGDLGVRMAQAFRDFSGRQTVLVGADIPALGAEDIRAAFKALKHSHAVFGPAADGGYYLVGMSARRPVRPFANVRWSSPEALADTLENFRGLRVRKLRVLRDVDTAADLSEMFHQARH